MGRAGLHGVSLSCCPCEAKFHLLQKTLSMHDVQIGTAHRDENLLTDIGLKSGDAPDGNVAVTPQEEKL